MSASIGSVWARYGLGIATFWLSIGSVSVCVSSQYRDLSARCRVGVGSVLGSIGSVSLRCQLDTDISRFGMGFVSARSRDRSARYQFGIWIY